MSVETFGIQLLNFEDVSVPDRITPDQLLLLLKIWRNGQETSVECCTICDKKLNICPSAFTSPDVTDNSSSSTIMLSSSFYRNFKVCCNRFYYKVLKRNYNNYIVHSLAIPTPGYTFVLPQLQRTLVKNKIRTNQDFFVLPDPIFWQIPSTLIFEKTCKLVLGQPMTKKTSLVLPASKSNIFYKQLQEAPLNHGSLFKRSGGKNTFFRQIAFGKRCILSARAMIVPDANLRSNEIALPRQIQTSFNVLGKWIILNRMPSLHPENFVALKVARIWDEECFGIPLEIVRALNADFDGDECNLYWIPNIQSQVECEILLNSENNLGSFSLGLKLSPSQDMLIAYHLKRDTIMTLLNDKVQIMEDQSLSVVCQTLFDLYGSQITFQFLNEMRLYYLDFFQNEMAFGISVAEIERLVEMAESSQNFEEFENQILNPTQSSTYRDGCLVTQVKAEAKGSLFHLYQMFGNLELQPSSTRASFWKGLTPEQSIQHAIIAHEGLLKSSNIWQPGYGYSKSVYNLQSLQVDYLGRLVDDHVVLETDVLNAFHHTDLMNPYAFEQLLKQELHN